jgi:hypothetical protein
MNYDQTDDHHNTQQHGAFYRSGTILLGKEINERTEQRTSHDLNSPILNWEDIPNKTIEPILTNEGIRQKKWNKLIVMGVINDR